MFWQDVESLEGIERAFVSLQAPHTRTRTHIHIHAQTRHTEEAALADDFLDRMAMRTAVSVHQMRLWL